MRRKVLDYALGITTEVLYTLALTAVAVAIVLVAIWWS